MHFECAVIHDIQQRRPAAHAFMRLGASLYNLAGKRSKHFAALHLDLIDLAFGLRLYLPCLGQRYFEASYGVEGGQLLLVCQFFSRRSAGSLRSIELCLIGTAVELGENIAFLNAWPSAKGMLMMRPASSLDSVAWCWARNTPRALRSLAV